MIDIKIRHEIEEIESRIEELKWRIRSSNKSKSPLSRLIKISAGILGRKFPSGIAYENRARKAWQKRFKNGS